MLESTNAFGIPDDEIDTCIYCEEQHAAGELDDLELCPECQKLDLVQCPGCGDIYNCFDMVDDDCINCIRRYRNA
jgi:cupin superfamily acireductone dioxygenase involved in methionine salvage